MNPVKMRILSVSSKELGIAFVIFYDENAAITIFQLHFTTVK